MTDSPVEQSAVLAVQLLERRFTSQRRKLVKQQKFDNSMPYDTEAPMRSLKHYEIAQQTVATVDIVGDQDVIVATANFGEFQGIGSSRRAAGDERDMMLGIGLATQRALESLVKRLARHNREAIQRVVVEQYDAIEERDRRAKITDAQDARTAHNRTFPHLADDRRRKGRAEREALTKQTDTPALEAESHGTIVLTIGE